MEELQLTKKEYNIFLENIDSYIVELSDKITLSDEKFSMIDIKKTEDYFSEIKNNMNKNDILCFWAYFGEAMRCYVGGEYKLASKSEDVAFTPIIINYGYKKKWRVRLSPEVWRDKLIRNKLHVSLAEHIKYLDDDYGK
jgi:hypothetical protein